MSAAHCFWIIAFSLLISTVPTVVALACDARKLDGDPIWSKPLKFEVSLAVHFATLAWLAGDLPDRYLADNMTGTDGV